MKNGCPFCDYAGPSDIAYEWSDALAFAPLVEVTPGHTLIVPKAHATDFEHNPDITGLVFRRAAEYAKLIDIDDANLITSKGPSATQTVRHVHVHLLPRFPGDGLTLPWANLNRI